MVTRERPIRAHALHRRAPAPASRSPGSVRREVAPNLERWREQHLIDREVWLEAGRQDFLGFAMPPELGGTGLRDLRFNQVLGEEQAAAFVVVNSALMLAVGVVA